MKRPEILIVEDELITAYDLQEKLNALDYKITGIVSSGEEAIEETAKHKPDLILMDIILSSDITGIDAAREILKQNDIPIIYLTANADIKTVETARDTKPYGYINKPYSTHDLFSNIDSALNKHLIETKLRESEKNNARNLEVLEKKEKQFRAVADTAVDGIITANNRGEIIYVNKSIIDIFGYSEAELIGNSIKNIMPERFRKNHQRSMGNFILTGEKK